MTRQFRTLLRSTLLTTMTLGLSALPALAAKNIAEPEVYFYPAQGWSVGQQGQSCSIASQFNNGFVMQFRGGEKWIQGMNINFRQDIFDPAKIYDVTLSVPGIQSETLKAKSQGMNTLDMSLRREKEFYQALRKAAVLDLSLDGNEFRFYLTGFSQKAVKFESCMAALTGPNTDASYMVNESIAMEEKVKAEQGVVEITAKDPKPVIQEIPFKETVKVGDIPVQETVTQEASTDATPEAILDTEVQDIVPTKPVEVAETPKELERIGRKRLSQMLAEQIEEDPGLIEVDEAKKPDIPTERKALAMPPNMDELAALPESDPVITPEPTAEAVMAEELAAAQEEPIEALKAETQPVEEPRAPEVIAFEDPTANPEPAKEKRDMLAENILAQDPVPMAKAEPEEVQKQAPAPEPMEATPIEEAKEVSPAPVAPPEPKTIYKDKTPPIKVRKETMTAEADFTNIEPAMGRPSQEMRKQVLELERTIETLKAENKALNNELSSALSESEEERLSISSENWNLERATMKFNEAERQISRLGQQLQREKAKCSAEKRDLEAMLFDPQVTDQAQMARLADLEEKLMKAEQELEDQRLRYEEQLRERWEAGRNSTQ